MANCYQGTVLHVDLTRGSLTFEHPEEEFYRSFGGGSAMGLYYILKNVPNKVDAFSPRNVLTMFTGLPTALPISGQSRLSVNAISPLTEGIGDSQSGGFFPAALKQSGFDGIVITGASSKPIYLLLDNGKAELRPADDIWGKTTAEVDEILAHDLGGGKIEIPPGIDHEYA
jgi:aldehyde:ferredoxin oxidoreductase